VSAVVHGVPLGFRPDYRARIRAIYERLTTPDAPRSGDDEGLPGGFNPYRTIGRHGRRIDSSAHDLHRGLVWRRSRLAHDAPYLVRVTEGPCVEGSSETLKANRQTGGSRGSLACR
jgi:hypothetical protein